MDKYKIQILTMDKLAKIPSEFIEPYLIRFLSIQIESVAFGLISPDEARKNLAGVEYFVTCFCGVHANIATGYKYGRFCRLTDEHMIEICKYALKNN